jgi:hypothetical protein
MEKKVHFYLSTLLHLLHQKKLFERKFVLLFNIFLFFNGSAAILPSSESSSEWKVHSLPPLGFEPATFSMLAHLSEHSAKSHPTEQNINLLFHRAGAVKGKCSQYLNETGWPGKKRIRLIDHQFSPGHTQRCAAFHTPKMSIIVKMCLLDIIGRRRRSRYKSRRPSSIDQS